MHLSDGVGLFLDCICTSLYKSFSFVSRLNTTILCIYFMNIYDRSQLSPHCLNVTNI
jgi:hypothetical protein